MDDLAKIIPSFVSDCRDNLDDFESLVLRLEKGENDDASFDDMFRKVHNIKGASNYLKFNNLSILSHNTENIIDLLRKKIATVDGKLTAVLLKICDTFKEMLLFIEKNHCEDKDFDYSLVVHQLNTIISQALLSHQNEQANIEIEEASRLNAKKAARNLDKNLIDTRKGNIRVDIDTLDNLVSITSELVLVRNEILELSTSDNKNYYKTSFNNLNNITGALQKTVLETRMQPISSLWSKLPRIIHTLSKTFDKKIDLVMKGEQTELDRQIIEIISDPFIHMIRNACDHGLETTAERLEHGKPEIGLIELNARQDKNWIYIDIIDDGRGIDLEKIKEKAINKRLYDSYQLEHMNDEQLLNIIFLPGFSTAEKVSDISGRGVGMDVIKANLSKINGSIEISSQKNLGTQIKIKLPLTLAIIPAVIMSINGLRYAVPQNLIQEVHALQEDMFESIEDVQGQKFIKLRDEILPIVYTDSILPKNYDSIPLKKRNNFFAVIDTDGYRYGLVIDRFEHISEIVVKPHEIKDLGFFTGATIMGDGKVAMILDVLTVAKHFSLSKKNISINYQELEDKREYEQQKKLCLMFTLDDGNNYLIPIQSKSRIIEILVSKLESKTDGRYLKHNQKIVKIIDLFAALGLTKPFGKIKRKRVNYIKLLQCDFGYYSYGIDIGYDIKLINTNYEIECFSDTKYVKGNTVIEDEIYTVIDLENYLRDLTLETYAQQMSESDIDLKIDEDKSNRQKDREKALQNPFSYLVSFELGGQRFGIAAKYINEILYFKEITPIDKYASDLLGLINLRGEIIPVQELKKTLGIFDENSTSRSKIKNRSLIVEYQNSKMCLKVGEVKEISQFHPEHLHPLPKNIPDNILKYAHSLYSDNNKMTIILDIPKIISKISSNIDLDFVEN